MNYSAQLTLLAKLSDNWDGEGADKPSQECISAAEQDLLWLMNNNMPVESVEPDVMGGVAIWLRWAPKETAWISYMNNGAQTVAFSAFNGSYALEWNDFAKSVLKQKMLYKPALSRWSPQS